jgi:hypothetical protein
MFAFDTGCIKLSSRLSIGTGDLTEAINAKELAAPESTRRRISGLPAIQMVAGAWSPRNVARRDG